MRQGTDFHEATVRYSLVALGFVVFLWSAYAFAAAGVFSNTTTMSLALVASVAIAIFLFRWLALESLVARIIFLLAIACAAILLTGAAPSIFSGRDQGSIAEAAIELSENGRFAFSSSSTDTFYALYGRGKALNFPGFFYAADGSLHSQFPGSYIAWVGLFHSLFGPSGLIMGNGILLILSLLTIFVLVRNLADEVAASGAFLVAATSFIPAWFAKFTLTENLGLFLFLLLALAIVLFLRSPRRMLFLTALLSAVLLAVTRIEGLLILVIAVGLLFASKPAKSFAFSRSVLTRSATLFGIISVLILDFLGNVTRYASIAKALLRTASDPSSASAPWSDVSDLITGAIELWKLFLPYGLLLTILLGLGGIAVLLVKKDRIGIIPALLAFPTFLYLVDPNISSDHPWMLRRLMFSVWPALLVTFSVASASLFSTKDALGRKIVIAIMALVAVAGAVPTISVLGFSENRKLLEETRRLADAVGPRDLILVDREATGDPYAIPAGPLRFLFGKNAAYFFNPDDFAKIQKDRYDHIYLLAPVDGFEKWSSLKASFSLISVYSFETERLGPLPLDDPTFPDKTSTTTDSLLFSLDPL
jgi:hypothetical protein